MRWPAWASCRFRISLRVESPLRRTPRWFASSGAEAVFVGSGIFKSSDPEARAKAIVKATTHFEDPKAVLEAHEQLGEAMPGIDVRQLEEKDLLATRGW